jgi:galactose mutarotase-like enzyme
VSAATPERASSSLASKLRTTTRTAGVLTGDPLGPDRRRKAGAIEPMTCPANASVTAHDLLVLEPGQAVTHTLGIQVLTD